MAAAAVAFGLSGRVLLTLADAPSNAPADAAVAPLDAAVATLDAAFAPADSAEDSSGAFRAAAALAFGRIGRVLLTLAFGAAFVDAFGDAVAPFAPLDVAVAPFAPLVAVVAPFAPLVAVVAPFAPLDAVVAPADSADDSSGAFRAAAALAFGLSGRVLLTKDTLSACADFVCLTSPPVL